MSEPMKEEVMAENKFVLVEERESRKNHVILTIDWDKQTVGIIENEGMNLYICNTMCLSDVEKKIKQD